MTVIGTTGSGRNRSTGGDDALYHSNRSTSRDPSRPTGRQGRGRHFNRNLRNFESSFVRCSDGLRFSALSLPQISFHRSEQVSYDAGAVLAGLPGAGSPSKRATSPRYHELLRSARASSAAHDTSQSAALRSKPAAASVSSRDEREALSTRPTPPASQLARCNG